eukprot:1171906-Rhodomonas_salina.2
MGAAYEHMGMPGSSLRIPYAMSGTHIQHATPGDAEKAYQKGLEIDAGTDSATAYARAMRCPILT